MKTRDAFAFRDFDANKFLSTAMKESGLTLTPKELLGTIGEGFGEVDGDLVVVGVRQVSLAALGVDTTDINSLQDARRKFFALQTRLDDFIRRIIRHQQRLKDFAMYTFNTKISAFLFTQYTKIINSVLPYTYAVKGTVDDIDTLQRRYFKDIFATRLRAARKAAGLKQSDVAAQIGLNQNSYSAYEQKRNLPTVAMLGILCRVLDTTPNKLLDF